MRKAVLPILAVGLVLLGLSLYLHSIDHPTNATTSNYISPSQLTAPTIYGNVSALSALEKPSTPPLYANFWPFSLIAGFALLIPGLYWIYKDYRMRRV
ncbi:hypothetical protein [Metallosphaera sedula]|uniref:hypothetical protein n=1 Tax=Metallosphaera sedula TaxID=43687 RepID=UPI0020C0FD6A|nr:hypothetical protein [Metallosphaera sedula]BBL46090.1 hypothetical protein MJ1HA_0182 [Metallosphaera sedula]